MRAPWFLSRQPPKLVLFINGLTYGHAVSLRFCRLVIPNSCQIVLTRHAKTTSCQYKLVTTHEFSVECPRTQSQPYSHWFSNKQYYLSIPTPTSLTSAHEVMNQLYTPNTHSVIASDDEMCRRTPPQLCLYPCLLNRVRVSEPQAEHKTMSVG